MLSGSQKKYGQISKLADWQINKPFFTKFAAQF